MKQVVNALVEELKCGRHTRRLGTHRSVVLESPRPDVMIPDI